jgi:hypothetical protein
MRMTVSSIQQSAGPGAPRIIIYGMGGVGKTTFAASAPDVVFLSAENGHGFVKGKTVSSFPIAKSYHDVLDALDSLVSEQHQFRSLAIDSIDWVQSLCERQVAIDKRAKSFGEIGWGEGPKLVADKMSALLDKLQLLSDSGMIVVIIGHAQIKSFKDPERDAYDRYSMKLHKDVNDKLMEWCDVQAFANWDTDVKQSGGGFNKYNRGISSSSRYLHCDRSAAYDAKNRMGLPARIPLDWDVFFNVMVSSIKGVENE